MRSLKLPPALVEHVRLLGIVLIAIILLLVMGKLLVMGIAEQAKLDGQRAVWTSWRDLHCRQVQERVEKSPMAIKYPGVAERRIRTWSCTNGARYIEVDGEQPARWFPAK